MNFAIEYDRLTRLMASVWRKWRHAYVRHEDDLCAELGDRYCRLHSEFELLMGGVK